MSAITHSTIRGPCLPRGKRGKRSSEGWMFHFEPCRLKTHRQSIIEAFASAPTLASCVVSLFVNCNIHRCIDMFPYVCYFLVCNLTKIKQYKPFITSLPQYHYCLLATIKRRLSGLTMVKNPARLTLPVTGSGDALPAMSRKMLLPQAFAS